VNAPDVLGYDDQVSSAIVLQCHKRYTAVPHYGKFNEVETDGFMSNCSGELLQSVTDARDLSRSL